MNKLPIYLMLFLGVFAACQKDPINTDPNSVLHFSEDTVMFDTVFTTIGSTTEWLKIYNQGNQNIRIDEIRLAGGNESVFRLNIDGILSNTARDIDILPDDSLYIFVEVTVDPTGKNLPMVIQDSIVFTSGDNQQDVDLVAYGQDFHLINGEIIKSQTWINDKPYLIYNSMMVDSLEKLKIESGCRIHFHKGSSMLVKGSLEARGTFEEPITFQGDRLEDFYDDVPGQWGDWLELENGGKYILGGIHFLQGSRDNVIDWAVIKNGNKGIQIDSTMNMNEPNLILTNTRIENMTLNCIDARSTNILASNCVFANTGSYTLALLLGGSYEFYHCTIANFYGLGNRMESALILNNYFIYDNQAYVYDLQNAYFGNCIIYGNRFSELEIDNIYNDQNGSGNFNYTFDHCLIQLDTLNTSNKDHFIQIIKNQNPKFVSIIEHDYHLDTLSIAKDTANLEISNFFPIDLDNKSRLSDGKSDLGAYERVEEK